MNESCKINKKIGFYFVLKNRDLLRGNWKLQWLRLLFFFCKKSSCEGALEWAHSNYPCESSYFTFVPNHNAISRFTAWHLLWCQNARLFTANSTSMSKISRKTKRNTFSFSIIFFPFLYSLNIQVAQMRKRGNISCQGIFCRGNF